MTLSGVRLQSAVVRALLDEFDESCESCAVVPGEEFGEQLIEELARLGCQILEYASGMVRTGRLAHFGSAS